MSADRSNLGAKRGQAIRKTFWLALFLATPSSGSQAAVTISTNATQNMDCAVGVCSPTALNAVLNVSDLETLLASGDITVATTGSGVQANDIEVTTELSWSDVNILSLDAYRSITFDAPVSVQGQGGLSLVTNDGGKHGSLSFASGGDVTFQTLSSALVINGTSYTLVNSISSLASAVADDPKGNYAFASSYDAGSDGTYSHSPVDTDFQGEFEGLGNIILNLTVANSMDRAAVGLFTTAAHAKFAHLGLASANISNTLRFGHIGILAGNAANSTVDQVQVSGAVGARRAYAGGLFGYTTSTQINRSHSNASVLVTGGDSSVLGGLVGFSDVGDVTTLSFATGSVSAGNRTAVGGLVGQTYGTIIRSFATGNASGAKNSSVGGLVGVNIGNLADCYANGAISSLFHEGGLLGGNHGTVARSYSIGMVAAGATSAGGLIGYDDSEPGSLTKTYWDKTTSGIENKSQGAGNVANDPGIKGRTTEQLQSGLPKGFSGKVWGENANINGGLPYLLANPPPQ